MGFPPSCPLPGGHTDRQTIAYIRHGDPSPPGPLGVAVGRLGGTGTIPPTLVLPEMEERDLWQKGRRGGWTLRQPESWVGVRR